MSSKSYFEDADGGSSKFMKKAKESPFMIVGIAGFIAVGLIGAYKFKNRGTMSTSVFLMQLRVAAQGTVAGCLTLGVAYNMFSEHFNKKTKEEAKLTN